jgi:GT2 family glycosyltransferase
LLLPLSIIIVNWNAGSQLAEAVTSIALHHCNLVESVIIIDNASSDDSLAQAEALIDLPFKIVVIRNTANCGFAMACNQGANQSKCKYILFLNPDAALYANTLTKVWEFMEEAGNSKVGICGVQLLNEAGHIWRSCSRFPSAFSFIAKSLGLTTLVPQLNHVMSGWDHSETRKVNQLIGAFFFVRLNLFQALGGFDERFFVYFEEVDFSRRSFQAGWSSMYLASTQAFHAGGGTSDQIKARRLFYSLQSRLLYAKKHFSILGRLSTFVATIFLEPISRCALAFFHRSWSSIKETCIAYYMLWCWLLRQIIQRKKP